MTAKSHVTRFRPDPISMAAYGALLVGGVAGFGLGVGLTMQFSGAPPTHVAPYEAPEVCELPPPSDPIGSLIHESLREPATYL